MTLLKSLVFLFALSIISCCSTTKTVKEAENGATTNTVSMDTKKMMASGYEKATTVASSLTGDCPFTLQIEGDNSYLLDPINLEEDYKKDGMKLWVKYTPLRMMNRCDKANPVNIVEIQRREE
jgi:type III secretory pathway component EscV